MTGAATRAAWPEAVGGRWSTWLGDASGAPRTPATGDLRDMPAPDPYAI